MKKINKTDFKMIPEELQSWIAIKKRTSIVKSKRGKGSFKRKEKYPIDFN